MIDPVSLIASAATLGSNVFNTISQNSINRKNRDFQLDMWNKTNAYNTPLEQRKRMEAAGFNPNLVYGHGTVANTASPSNVPDARMAPLDLGTPISQYADTRNKNVQTANALLDADLKKMTMLKMSAETAGIEIKNELGRGTLQSSIDAQKELLRKYELENEYAPVNQGQKQQLVNMQLSNLASDLETKKLSRDEAEARIKNIGQQLIESGVRIDSSRVRTAIDQIILEMRQKGVSPNDPIYIRAIERVINYFIK